MEQDTAERIAGLEMQLKIFRWAVGGFCLLVMTFSGSLASWVYGQGSDMTALAADLNYQKQITRQHSAKINKSAETSVETNKNVLKNKLHLEQIKDTLREIKSILKEKK